MSANAVMSPIGFIPNPLEHLGVDPDDADDPPQAIFTEFSAKLTRIRHITPTEAEDKTNIVAGQSSSSVFYPVGLILEVQALSGLSRMISTLMGILSFMSSRVLFLKREYYKSSLFQVLF